MVDIANASSAASQGLLAGQRLDPLSSEESVCVPSSLVSGFSAGVVSTSGHLSHVVAWE